MPKTTSRPKGQRKSPEVQTEKMQTHVKRLQFQLDRNADAVLAGVDRSQSMITMLLDSAGAYKVPEANSRSGAHAFDDENKFVFEMNALGWQHNKIAAWTGRTALATRLTLCKYKKQREEDGLSRNISRDEYKCLLARSGPQDESEVMQLAMTLVELSTQPTHSPDVKRSCDESRKLMSIDYVLNSKEQSEQPERTVTPESTSPVRQTERPAMQPQSNNRARPEPSLAYIVLGWDGEGVQDQEE